MTQSTPCSQLLSLAVALICPSLVGTESWLQPMGAQGACSCWCNLMIAVDVVRMYCTSKGEQHANVGGMMLNKCVVLMS